MADTTLLTCVLGYICTGGALHWCDHAMQPWSMNTRQWYEQERLRKETHVSVDSGIFRANSDSPHGIDLSDVRMPWYPLPATLSVSVSLVRHCICWTVGGNARAGARARAAARFLQSSAGRFDVAIDRSRRLGCRCEIPGVVVWSGKNRKDTERTYVLEG